jgi:hypothetical protein
MSDLRTLNRKLKDHPGNKYYRLFIDAGEPQDLSVVSSQFHAVTGCYANEYVPPVESLGDIFTVISDESAFKGHSCISVVLMTYEEASRKIKECESRLEALCNEYKIKDIHFTDIIGRKSLGRAVNEFLHKYVAILGEGEIWASTFSVNKSDFLSGLQFENVSDRELYFILFWNVMEFIVEQVPPGSIFHLNFEQENNLTVNLATEYIGKLHDGINQCQSLKERRASICRHPYFFSKRALLFSSLSDLAAYSNNVLQQKLDAGIPAHKLLKNHDLLIDVTRRVFKHFSGLHQSKHGAADLIMRGCKS